MKSTVPRLFSALLVGLLISSFLGLAISPVHAASNTQVSNYNFYVLGVSSTMQAITIINAGDLLVLQSQCSDFGISTVTDSQGNIWSRDNPDAPGGGISGGTTHYNLPPWTLSDWSTAPQSTGVLTVTITFAGTNGACTVFMGEWNTFAVNFNTRFTTSALSQCREASTIATPNPTLAHGDCAHPGFNTDHPTAHTDAAGINLAPGSITIAVAQTNCTGSASGTKPSVRFAAGFSNAIPPTNLLNFAYCGGVYSPDSVVQSYAYYDNGAEGINMSASLTLNDVGAPSGTWQQDVSCSVLFGSCHVWYFFVTEDVLVFSGTGSRTVFPSQSTFNGCPGLPTPPVSPTSVKIASNQTYYYVGQTAAAGMVINDINAFLDPTNTSLTDSQQSFTLFMGLYAGAPNSIGQAVSASNPLTNLGFAFRVIHPGTMSSLYTISTSRAIPPNAWYAVAVMVSHDGVGMFKFTNNTQQMFNSATTLLAVANQNITVNFPSSPALCFDSFGSQGTVLQTVTNVIVTSTTNITTTTTCASGADCATVTITRTTVTTSTQVVNAPDIKAYFYWLFPMIFTFAPMVIVIALVARARLTNEDASIVFGLLAVTISSWAGFGLSQQFEPIYFPIVFTVITFVYFLRR